MPFSLATLWKLLGICGVFGLLAFSIFQYGSARERSGMLQQMNAQVNTDNQRLMTQAETMVNAFKQTQASLNDLRKTPDPSTAPSSIQSTIRRLCEQRKAAGVPCVAPRPADKPIIE